MRGAYELKKERCKLIAAPAVRAAERAAKNLRLPKRRECFSRDIRPAAYGLYRVDCSRGALCAAGNREDLAVRKGFG